MPELPIYLDDSRAWALVLELGAGVGSLDRFLSNSFHSPSLRETGRYRPKYCLKWVIKRKSNEATNLTSILRGLFVSNSNKWHSVLNSIF